MSENGSIEPPLPPPSKPPLLPSGEGERQDSMVFSLKNGALDELIVRATADELTAALSPLDLEQRRRLEKLCEEIITPQEQALVVMTDVPPEDVVLQGPSMAPPEAIVGVGAPSLPQDWQVPTTLALRNQAPIPIQNTSRLAKLRNFDPKKQLLEFCFRLPSLYCESLARRHWAFLLFYCLIITIVVSAGWRRVEVNTDIEAFGRVEGLAASRHIVYREALKHQNAIKDADSLADRKTFQLEIYYEAKSGSVFAEAPLRDIKAFENNLRGLGGWAKMCAMSDPAARFRCQPGESMANYAWPQRAEIVQSTPTPFNLDFNGESLERLPVDAFLTYLHEGRAGPHDLKKFLPHASAGPQSDSTLLRSIFSFTAASQDSSAFEEAFDVFVSEELFYFLQEQVEKAEETPSDPWIDPSSVRLFYRSAEIETHEVRYFLAKDLKLTIGCLVFIFIFLVFQLRSLLLAFAGLTQVCLVPLIAYALVPIEELSIIGFACIFLLVGLSSNDLPALKDHWRRLGKESDHKLPVSNPGSAAYNDEMTMYFAHRASLLFPALFLRLLPQFVVSVSFLVFLSSSIRPIREFGLFMCVGISVSCVVTLTALPALILIHEAWICPFLHRRLPFWLAMALEPKNLPFPWRPLTRLLLKISQPWIGRWIWLGTGVVSLIIFIIAVAVAAGSDNPGVPEVYAPDHHYIASQLLVDAFLPTAPALEPAPSGTRVCEMEYGNSAECGLHWCEAPQAPQASDTASDTTSTTTVVIANTNQECVCQSSGAPASAACRYVNVSGKLAGQSFEGVADDDRSTVWRNHILSSIPNVNSSFTVTSSRRTSSLVLEHWESGVTNVEPVVEMPWTVVQIGSPSVEPNSYNTCDYTTSCYCGLRVCTLPTAWSAAGTLTFPITTNRLLSASGGPTPSLSEVNVAFGITVSEETGHFSGKPIDYTIGDFDPSDPWAQRRMLSVCTDLPANLNVVEKKCWIESFREWLLAGGEKFPTQRFGDFQADLKRFKEERSDVVMTAEWTDVNGNMIATAFDFLVTPIPRSEVSLILDEMNAWEMYVITSGGWATSNSWYEAQAEHEAMSNSWMLMLTAYLLVVLAGLLYTWDLAFTCITVGIATLALIFLSFMMFCLFGWAIGPWEVILLVVFLFYIVEPAFRVGRGAVWAGVLVTEMRIAGNVLPPRVAPPPQQLQLPPPEVQQVVDVETPGQIADVENPSPETPSPIMDLPHVAAAQSPAMLNPDPYVRHATTLGSDNISEDSGHIEAMARSAFEARLTRFTLNIANAVWPSALKLIFCAFFLLFCKFRLFSRLGVVTFVVQIILLPCTFILLPSAILLCPTREEPDIILLHGWIKQKMKERQERLDD